jgi:hypothetical protein
MGALIAQGLLSRERKRADFIPQKRLSTQARRPRLPELLEEVGYRH